MAGSPLAQQPKWAEKQECHKEHAWQQTPLPARLPLRNDGVPSQRPSRAPAPREVRWALASAGRVRPGAGLEPDGGRVRARR